ncbi:MAG: RNA-dependent RNA polymerase [Sanya chuvirus 1]|nr:MAG: RNA-dependent RNA polymerase [Sanya chuvirus 1]
MYDESQKRGPLLANPFHAIGDRKLDTALRDTTALCFLARLKNNEETVLDTFLVEQAKTCLGWDQESHTLKPNINIFPALYLSAHKYDRRFCDSFARCGRLMSIIKKNLLLQLDYLYNSVRVPVMMQDRGSLEHKITSMSIPLDFSRYICTAWDTEKMVTLTTMTKFTQYDMTNNIGNLRKWAVYHCKNQQFSCVWNGHLTILKFEGNFYIMPQAYLLLIHNKFCDILSVLMYALVSEESFYEAHSLSITLSFLEDFATLSFRYQDKFSHIAKILESLGTGLTLIDVDGIGNSQFHNYIVNTLYEEHNIDITGTHIYRMMSESSIPFRHELMCLSKVMGHPFVNMHEGTAKIRDKSSEINEVDQEYIRDTISHLKKKFIKAHVFNSKCWPPVELEYGCPEGLAKACLRGLDPDSNMIRNRFGEIPIRAYEYVNLRPVMKYIKYENLIPLLKDRTQSVLRSKVFRNYLREDADRGQIKWEETRVLLFYLLTSSKHTDHVKYIDEFNDAESIDNFMDYMVIRLVPKEKELKTAYRGFGCQTFFDRARRQVQEKNAYRWMEEYDQEQALTLSEIEIARKLYSIRVIQHAFPGYKAITMVVDASTWCSKMRSEFIDVVSKETLDKMFDVRHFGRTMECFQKTLFYVPDEKKPVEYWKGQLGGIEGLNQGVWEICWTPGLQVIMERELKGLKIIKFVKGDDTKIAVLVPNHLLETTPLLDIKNRVIRVIAEGAKMMGHSINQEESYGSLRYFSFSKNASVDDIELPQGFRKIQKTYGANNAFMPTSDEYISSAFSNAHSTCRVACHVLPAYSVALFWATYHILMNGGFSSMTDDNIVGLELVPSLLGGFPIIYLHNMFVRAESDLLTPFLSLLAVAESRSPGAHKVMKHFLKVKTVDVEIAIKGLMVDPYSIPISKPSSPTTILRSQVAPILRVHGKNEQVQQLFALADSGVNRELESIMLSLNVFNPKIMALTFSSSPEGLIQELTRKFESGRSICELIIKTLGRKKASSILRTVLRAEWSLQSWRLSVMKGRHRGMCTDLSDYIVGCPAESANNIREALWGRPVEAITMPDMAHLIYYIDAKDGPRDEWAENHHFLYTFTHESNRRLPGEDLQGFRSAGSRPFFGHKTKTNLMTSTIRMIDKDELLTKVQTLIDLVSWTNTYEIDSEGVTTESNFKEVINYLLSLYLDISPEELTVFRATKKSGSIQHHVRAPGFREEIMPNTLSNIYLSSTGASSSHVHYRMDQSHYRINFLHVLCHTIALYHMYLNTYPAFRKDQKIWAVTNDCIYCNRPIVETPLTVDASRIPKGVGKEFHELKLSSEALELVLSAIDDPVKKIHKEFNSPDSIKEEYACLAMMQDFIKETYLSRIRLQDALCQHTMNDMSYPILSNLMPGKEARVIGMTEMSRVPNQIIIDHLVTRIGYEITFVLGKKTILGADMWLKTIPPAELPWYETIRHIELLGRLQSIMVDMRKQANLKLQCPQGDYLTATRIVGMASVRLYLTMRRPPSLMIYMSSYEINDLTLFVEPHITILKNFCMRELKPRLDVPEDVDVELSRRIKKSFLWITLCADPAYIGQDEDLLAAKVHSLTHILWWDIKYMDTDKMVEFLEDEDLRQAWCDDHGLDPDSSLEWATVANEMIESEYDLDWPVEFVTLIPLRIFYTDRESCVNIVRTLPPVQLDSLKPMDSILEKSDSKTFMSPPATCPEEMIGFEHLPFNIPVPENLFPHPSPEPIIKAGIFPDPAWQHRPLALVTSACNKLLDILKVLQVSKLPDKSRYMCVGEGDGGFAAVISSLTNHSTIYVNTLKPNEDTEYMPSDLMAKCRNDKNNADFRGVNLGYGNFSYSRSIDYYLSTVKKIELMTVDAQTSVLSERSDLVLNACTLYLNNRSRPGSLMIIKLFLAEMDINARVYGSLSQVCSKFILLKPKSSKINDEIYMVSWGLTKGRVPGHKLNKSMYPSLYAYNRFVTAVLSIREQVLKWQDISMNSVNINVAANRIPFYVKGFLFSPLMSLHKIVGIEFPADISLDFKTSKKEINSLNNRLILSTRKVLKIFSKKTSGDMKGMETQHWYNNTLTAALIHARSAMACCGLILVLERFKRNISHLTMSDIRFSFDTDLTHISPRFVRVLDDPDRFQATHRVGAVSSGLFSSYVTGVTLGLSILTVYNCIQL